MSRDLDIFLHAARVLPSYCTLRVAAALVTLEGAPGPLRTREIATRCAIPKPSVSRLVDTLERAALAARKRDPRDGRGCFVELTDAGRALVREMSALRAADQARAA